MKITRTILAAALGSAMVLSLSACNSSNPGSSGGESVANQSSAAVATSAPLRNQSGSGMATQPMNASTAAMPPAMAGSQAMAHGGTGTNWFGGPIYKGEPNWAATAALVKAGGGADNFSFAKALNSMLGEKTVNAEIKKLNQEYGKDKVDTFLKGATFVVTDALKHAKAQGITLPPPANLSGKALAKALVTAGTTSDGTFWAGYMLDHTISHKIHDQVMADVDAKYSHAVDGTTHKILNQTMYDVAQALGMKNVKLASFH